MDEDFKTTTSHTVIRGWVESNGGKPAMIVDPNRFDKSIGLRVDFPGKKDEALLSHSHQSKVVSWDEFFKAFEELELAFDYLLDPKDVALEDAYRFIKREALNDTPTTTPFNVDEFAKAVRDDEPAFFTHDGKNDDPHEGRVETVLTEDEIGEGELGGDMTDLESDDDTTRSASDLGLDEEDDPQAKHDRG